MASFPLNLQVVEMVRVTENRLEPPANGRGLFSYLFDNVEFNLPIFFLIDFQWPNLVEINKTT
jgi:hypothetical protein